MAIQVMKYVMKYTNSKSIQVYNSSIKKINVASGKSALFKQTQRIGKDEYSCNEVDRTEACNVIRIKFGIKAPDVDNPINIELPRGWTCLNPNESQSDSLALTWMKIHEIGGMGSDTSKPHLQKTLFRVVSCFVVRVF